MNFSKAHTSKKRTNLRNKDGMATLAIGNLILSKSSQIFARLVAYGSTVYTRANCHQNSVNTYFGELQTLPSRQTMPPNGCLCPPCWFTKDTCLEHHITKRQLTIV